MPQVSARQVRNAHQSAPVYSPPRLTKLTFSIEQIARIESAPDRETELAKVYREVRGL